MSTQELEAPTQPPEPSPRRWRVPRAWRERTDLVSRDRTLGQVLVGLRWGATAVWLGILIWKWYDNGIPFDRTGLLVWLGVGLACLCVGYHPIWLLWVAVDFCPFVAVLLAYDRLRGWSYTAGLPTWWTPQVDIDRFIGFGTVPTVWLQEHLKSVHYNYAKQQWVDVQWYDLGTCICYFSFFFLPYLLACVMWLRSRPDFYRWAIRFVGLSFVGFALFVLTPSAPPWAAARCTAGQVANHPNNPYCMWYGDPTTGGLLGKFTTHRPSANGYTELITTAGFGKLHLTAAENLVEHGRGWGDAVAAIPSLHVGGTVLFVLFMWGRLNKWWRPLLVAYPLFMMFTLAYGADHYVTDGIAGALCAWLVHWLADRGERWLKRRNPPDTLDVPPDNDQESACPPTATMPSST